LGIQEPRLYRNTTGAFFVRVLLDPVHVGSTPNSRETAKQEGAETVVADKNPKLARRTSSLPNAAP
jgi:hypothetical protein